ncbi:MAG: CYTH domain-containing protein [Leptolyngbya sp. SIO4C1]|nr:CYTH domain-containing protein [Leptolyngbya sp. SIO4C1]
MPKEIERKFLVKDERWRRLAVGQRYRQGYLPTQGRCTVRVRTVGNQGYLTIKGLAQGLTRPEFEYAIPVEEAQAMLTTLCERPFIDKVRYRIPLGAVVWEVDEFEAENAGLVLAEVELQHEDQALALPEWIGEEVTGDPRYYNVSLVKAPFQTWQR